MPSLPSPAQESHLRPGQRRKSARWRSITGSPSHESWGPVSREQKRSLTEDSGDFAALTNQSYSLIRPLGHLVAVVQIGHKVSKGNVAPGDPRGESSPRMQLWWPLTGGAASHGCILSARACWELSTSSLGRPSGEAIRCDKHSLLPPPCLVPACSPLSGMAEQAQSRTRGHPKTEQNFVLLFMIQ